MRNEQFKHLEKNQKKKFVSNIEELLTKQYGPIGTEERDKFEFESYFESLIKYKKEYNKIEFINKIRKLFKFSLLDNPYLNCITTLNYAFYKNIVYFMKDTLFMNYCNYGRAIV